MAFPSSPTNGQVYKDKIYNSTVLAWQDYNAVAPVSGEPSFGTLHPRTNATAFTCGSAVIGTYKIDCSSLVPSGTNAVWLYGNISSSNNSYHTFSQWGGAYSTIFVILAPAYINIGFCGMMFLDSNRWGQVIVSNANNTSGMNVNISGYWK